MIAMRARAFATTFLIVALISLAKMQMSSLAFANPYWHEPSPPPGQPESKWVYVQTITGNQSQTVDMFMPTQAHWRVSGSYVSSGVAGMTIYFGSQSDGSNSHSDVPGNFTWGVGLEHFGKEQVQGNVQIRIEASNILSYTLVAEYDNASVRPTFASSEAWVPKASPLTRYGQEVAEVNGKIYSMGGYRIGDVATSTNLQYDPVSDKWFEKKSMPGALAYFGTGVYQGEIYVIGGYMGSELAPTATNQVWAYNPQTDAWNQNITAMPTPRAGAQANTVDGKIYVIGGRNAAGFTNVNEAYDPTTNTWTAKTAILVPVSHYASTVVDGKIYVIGGLTRSPNGTQVSSGLNQIYDPKTDTWRIAASIPNTNVSFANAATTKSTFTPKKIYVISGNLTQIYDPANNRWTTGTPIPDPNSIGGFGEAVVVGVGDQLYSIGGVYIDSNLYSINAQYTPANDNQPSPSASPTANSTSTQPLAPSPTVPEFTPAVVFAFATMTCIIALVLSRRRCVK
jgi:N-acetylneuraminic acid mutarotase